MGPLPEGQVGCEEFDLQKLADRLGKERDSRVLELGRRNTDRSWTALWASWNRSSGAGEFCMAWILGSNHVESHGLPCHKANSHTQTGERSSFPTWREASGAELQQREEGAAGCS